MKHVENLKILSRKKKIIKTRTLNFFLLFSTHRYSIATSRVLYVRLGVYEVAKFYSFNKA